MRKFHILKDYQDKNIIIPKRETINSAGYDIACCGDYIIEPKKTCLINTGLKVEMNKDEVLMIFPRSSLARKKGLFLTNHVGVIDSDYFENEDNDGHILISVYNYTDQSVVLKDKDKIVQGVFTKFLTTDDDVTNKVRTGGFGSTS